MSTNNQIADPRLVSSYGLLRVEHLHDDLAEVVRHFDLDGDSPANTFSYRVLKRGFDIAVVLFVAPIALIIGALVALCVVLDSPGPVFFSHQRIKRGGGYFRMWKFRTMCRDASRVLELYLQRHPEDRKEWILHHKLKMDPRVSSIGTFLRRRSLDELPQLWNVLTGTMSLVGPRPIVTAEIMKYGADYVYYTAVKPGITGLWQTSGRSTLTYAERVALDRLYFENWSLWLEMKILVRTVWAVLRSDGAY